MALAFVKISGLRQTNPCRYTFCCSIVLMMFFLFLRRSAPSVMQIFMLSTLEDGACSVVFRSVLFSTRAPKLNRMTARTRAAFFVFQLITRLCFCCILLSMFVGIVLVVVAVSCPRVAVSNTIAS